MKPAWPDWSILVAIAATLLMVVALVFSVRPSQPDGPPLQWRDTPPLRGDSVQI